jgi:hypothetical protein
MSCSDSISDNPFTRHDQKVGCIKEIRIIGAERRECRRFVSVTASGNEVQHIQIYKSLTQQASIAISPAG